jgi:hypothetical protein
MATKRKVKRYDEGGMTEEDVRSFAGTPENDSNAGMAEAYEEPVAKKRSFKEAFAEARKAGDKSFEWEGKKFTTEFASPKKAPERVVAKKEEVAVEKPKYETSYDRMNRQNRESGKDFDSLVSGLKNRIMTASTRGNDRLLRDASIRKSDQKFMGSGMKKGGSVSSASSRGDGIAQRGKTKGRMV